MGTPLAVPRERRPRQLGPGPRRGPRDPPPGGPGPRDRDRGHDRVAGPAGGHPGQHRRLGVRVASGPWLTALSDHVGVDGYLFGARPSIADFAFYGGNAAHFVNDPLCWALGRRGRARRWPATPSASPSPTTRCSATGCRPARCPTRSSRSCARPGRHYLPWVAEATVEGRATVELRERRRPPTSPPPPSCAEARGVMLARYVESRTPEIDEVLDAAGILGFYADHVDQATEVPDPAPRPRPADNRPYPAGPRPTATPDPEPPMTDTRTPSYGTVDTDYAARLATTPPEDDGPVWMVNLMSYHDVAQYADGRDDADQRPRGRRPLRAPSTCWPTSGPSPSSSPRSTASCSATRRPGTASRSCGTRPAGRSSTCSPAPTSRRSTSTRRRAWPPPSSPAASPSPRRPTAWTPTTFPDWDDVAHPPTDEDGPVVVLHLIRFHPGQADDHMVSYQQAAARTAVPHGVRIGPVRRRALLGLVRRGGHHRGRRSPVGPGSVQRLPQPGRVHGRGHRPGAPRGPARPPRDGHRRHLHPDPAAHHGPPGRQHRSTDTTTETP